MRPTLRQLEYIVTVSRLGRFSLAAEVLNVSQPSLSTQIATVEQELGVRIFERNRGGIQVTAKGEEFILRAQKILAEVKDLRHAMSNDMPVGGRLRLGVLPSIRALSVAASHQTGAPDSPRIAHCGARGKHT